MQIFARKKILETETFRTVFGIAACPVRMDYDARIMLSGSCFSEHFGDWLRDLKFHCMANPYGVLYNPVSLASQYSDMLSGRSFDAQELFAVQGVFRSWDFHSRIAHPDRNAMLAMMHERVKTGAAFLKSSTHLVITFGTAHVFTLKETGRIVANNHKQPAALFSERMLQPKEIFDVWEALLRKIYALNPSLQIIFTLSPVRHLRDGAVENALSKAILLFSIRTLCNTFPAAYYFPAFEIMMDDLRDYRFYAEDMLHPSAEAFRYIAKRFRIACIDAKAYAAMEEIAAWQKAMHHRPLFPGSESHDVFINTLRRKLRELQEKYPGRDWSGEEAILQPSGN